ncbi:MAG: helix-turn-helix domain-containing protein [Acidobacteriia bacterium]|nr:helix-turn-helix domain-containing protein [Terriglobia bacterium]
MIEAEVKTTIPVERLSFSIAEAAAASGLCGRTIVNYINAGRLRVRRKGRRVLVMRQDLERFLNRDDPVVRWKPNGYGRSRKAERK